MTNLDKDNLRGKKEIRARVQSFILKDGVPDRWIWAKNVYMIKEVYVMILDGSLNYDNKDKELANVWSRIVPLKLSVLVWRLWKNKISAIDNLIKIGIIEESKIYFLFGCGKEKIVTHIFFECLIG